MTNLIHNAFLDDLGTDFVALNPQGTPVGRAGTREALEQAHAGADVTILDAAELAKLTPTLAEAATAKLDGPFAAVVAQGTAELEKPVKEEPVKEKDHPKKDPLDHDSDGRRGGHALNADKVAADKKAEAAKVEAAKKAHAKK